MDEVFDAIRAAMAPDATAELRAAGARACKALLGTLETTPTTSVQPTPPIANIVAALRSAPPEQLLDLAIAKLRAALPVGTNVPSATPVRFHLVQVPRP